MEIITILSVIAIIYLFINDYKISKNVRGLKTLVKVIYKEKYKNDNEIKKPVFPKRSDMQPPPSPEKIDCIYKEITDDMYNIKIVEKSDKKKNDYLEKKGFKRIDIKPNYSTEKEIEWIITQEDILKKIIIKSLVSKY